MLVLTTFLILDTPFSDTGRVNLDPEINSNAIEILISVGLKTRFPDLCRQFNGRKETIEADLKALEITEMAQSEQELTVDNLEDIILFEILRRMEQVLP